MMRCGIAIAGLALLTLQGACAQSRFNGGAIDKISLRQRAVDSLEAGIGYSSNPVVRVESVEALELTLPPSSSLPWVRSALSDEHPAVRFAACVAVGRLRDEASLPALEKLTKDPDDSVRVAALFSLHCLGHSELTGMMPEFLLANKNAGVRRNAAMVLGLMQEPGAVKMLARAMKDADPGVQQHALEAMARLGTPEARQELAFMSNAGVGSDETFAIHALAATHQRAYLDLYRNKLQTALHLETRLAAARALGSLDSHEGFELAYSTLRSYKAPEDGSQDSPEQRSLRVRELAIAALGAIGDDKALAGLDRIMEEEEDPRLQVAAAKAILEILNKERHESLPFPDTPGHRRQ